MKVEHLKKILEGVPDGIEVIIGSRDPADFATDLDFNQLCVAYAQREDCISESTGAKFSMYKVTEFDVELEAQPGCKKHLPNLYLFIEEIGSR
jgi:hypothetical protein